MLEIFQYDFMLRAFAAGVCVAIVAPLIGTFLVIRQQSFFADTLSHVALLGIALGLFIKAFPLAIALLVSVLSAIGLALVYSKKKTFHDANLALLLYGSLAVAVVLVAVSGGFTVDLLSFLFGSIVTVQNQDLYLISALSLLVITMIIVFYKELIFISFDDEVAKVSGVPVTFLNVTLMALAGIVVSSAMRTVGALLIGALLVIPAMTALQLAKSFQQTILLAIAVALISVLSGLTISFYAGLPTGGIIVLVALTCYLAGVVIKTAQA